MRKLEYDVGDVIQITKPSEEIFSVLWTDPSDDHMRWFGIGSDALNYEGDIGVIISKSQGDINGFIYHSYEIGAPTGRREDRTNWYYWPAWMLRLPGEVDPSWEL